MSDFESTTRDAFAFTVPSLLVGKALRDGTVHPDLTVQIPLAMMNRHGLIAGSTGTGKTRTLQLLAEGLSRNGVPTFVADVKGDLSGLARPGASSEKLLARAKSLGVDWKPETFPVEFFSLTGNRGTQVRATVSSFGPVLLGKVLDLSDVQQSVLAMVFKYCDDHKMPLLDFADLRDVLAYLDGEGKDDAKTYGGMSTATVGVLNRKMVELEQQGAAKFFGEPELEISDLMRNAPDGRGIVNVLTLSDIQDKPRLYSTFLMWLLGQFYYHLPEVGDLDKPKLVFFFDEAHLLFEDASSALVQHIEQVARLIRSKGIGVFFITQTPKDVEDDVLAQLGNRVQHAVRAFTPQDAKNLKAAASTFPASEYYKIDKTLTSLGIGEALTSVLNPKGVPTPSTVAMIGPPTSLMSQITDADYQQVIAQSAIAPKYANAIDRQSAHEILQQKLQASAAAPANQPEEEAQPRGKKPREEKSILAEVVDSTAGRQVMRTVGREVVRGLFGLLRR